MGLEDSLALLARADPDRLLDGDDEDLPVADVAGPRVLEDRLDDQGLVLVLDTTSIFSFGRTLTVRVEPR